MHDSSESAELHHHTGQTGIRLDMYDQPPIGQSQAFLILRELDLGSAVTEVDLVPPDFGPALFNSFMVLELNPGIGRQSKNTILKSNALGLLFQHDLNILLGYVVWQIEY